MYPVPALQVALSTLRWARRKERGKRKFEVESRTPTKHFAVFVLFAPPKGSNKLIDCNKDATAWKLCSEEKFDAKSTDSAHLRILVSSSHLGHDCQIQRGIIARDAVDTAEET